jgi:hypothetical protein
VKTPSASLKNACDCADSGVVRISPTIPPMMIPTAFKIAPVTFRLNHAACREQSAK